MFYAGITIFFGIHLVPLINGLKDNLKSRLGENMYMGSFSLISLLGFLLIVFGYKAGSDSLYSLNSEVYFYSKYIMFFSLTFLVAAYMPGFIKKLTRHPMSIGIGIWSTLHLLTNSDSVSVVLFSSFLAYSLISVFVSENRQIQVKEYTPKVLFDVLSVVTGALLTVLFFNFHAFLSGVSLS